MGPRPQDVGVIAHSLEADDGRVPSQDVDGYIYLRLGQVGAGPHQSKACWEGATSKTSPPCVSWGFRSPCRSWLHRREDPEDPGSCAWLTSLWVEAAEEWGDQNFFPNL